MLGAFGVDVGSISGMLGAFGVDVGSYFEVE